jgi:hypothetical protein
MGHPTITVIDTIPAGYHKYADPDTWTGGKHQEHKYRKAALIVFAVTNTAGQQHLQGHSQAFLAAWNKAKMAVKGDMCTPATLKGIHPAKNKAPVKNQAPKSLHPLLNKTGKLQIPQGHMHTSTWI